MQRTKWTMDKRKSSSSSSVRPRAFGFLGIDVDVIERLPTPLHSLSISGTALAVTWNKLA